MTARTAAGAPILGYRFENEWIAGEFWVDGGMTPVDFQHQIRGKTGTAPEVVGAYVNAQAIQQPERQGSNLDAIGANLPEFKAPAADIALMSRNSNAGEQRGDHSSSVTSSSTSASSSGDTWQPNDAQVMITPFSSTNLVIDARYSWYGLSPFASPVVMADHWGMEFQIDFYTEMRPLPPGTQVPVGYGLRPVCGHSDYKDWAAASTQEFDWFAWFISGPDLVTAPATLGLYGDYNDATDPCEVSTVAVGMAQPWEMPMDTWGGNHLSLYMYPLKGQESQSEVGAIVQPVSRSMCEWYPWMPLTDCMGVTPGTYPGPGPADSRMVLNSASNLTAPSLCWYSPNFGTTAAQTWAC